MLRQCFSSGTATDGYTPYKARPSQNWPKITTYDHVHKIFITFCTWFRRGVLCDRGLTLATSRPREAHTVDKRSPYSTPHPCGDWPSLYCLPSMGGQGYDRNQVSYTDHVNWNRNVTLMNFFLDAKQVGKMTTFSAVNDENFVKMTVSFQCRRCNGKNRNVMAISLGEWAEWQGTNFH